MIFPLNEIQGGKNHFESHLLSYLLQQIKSIKTTMLEWLRDTINREYYEKDWMSFDGKCIFKLGKRIWNKKKLVNHFVILSQKWFFFGGIPSTF